MLNQERVCEMTKLAIFDQKEGQECKPMIQYFRKDYVARELLKSLITGTVAFAVLCGVLGLYYVERLTDQISAFDLRQAAGRLCLGYAAFMAAYLLVTYAVYHVKYTKGRAKVRKYYMHLKKVNGIYREEE